MADKNSIDKAVTYYYIPKGKYVVSNEGDVLDIKSDMFFENTKQIQTFFQLIKEKNNNINNKNYGALIKESFGKIKKSDFNDFSINKHAGKMFSLPKGKYNYNGIDLFDLKSDVHFLKKEDVSKLLNNSIKSSIDYNSIIKYLEDNLQSLSAAKTKALKKINTNYDIPVTYKQDNNNKKNVKNELQELFSIVKKEIQESKINTKDVKNNKKYFILNPGTYDIGSYNLNVKEKMYFKNEKQLSKFIGLKEKDYNQGKEKYKNFIKSSISKKGAKEPSSTDFTLKLKDSETNLTVNKLAEIIKAENQNSDSKINSQIIKEEKPISKEKKVENKNKKKWILEKGEYRFQGFILNVNKDLYFSTQKELSNFIENQFSKDFNFEKVTKNSLAIMFKHKTKGEGESTIDDYKNNISLSRQENKKNNLFIPVKNKNINYDKPENMVFRKIKNELNYDKPENMVFRKTSDVLNYENPKNMFFRKTTDELNYENPKNQVFRKINNKLDYKNPVNKLYNKFLLKAGEYQITQDKTLVVPYDMYMDSEKDLSNFIKQNVGNRNSKKIAKENLSRSLTSRINNFNASDLKIKSPKILYTIPKGIYEFDGYKNKKAMYVDKDIHFDDKDSIEKYIKDNLKNGVSEDFINYGLSKRDLQYIDELSRYQKKIEYDNINKDYSSSVIYEDLGDPITINKELETANKDIKPTQVIFTDTGEIKEEILNNGINPDNLSNKVAEKVIQNVSRDIKKSNDNKNDNVKTDLDRIDEIETEYKLKKDIYDLDQKILEINKQATLEKKKYLDVLSDENATEKEKLNAMSSIKSIENSYQSNIDQLNAIKNNKINEIKIGRSTLENSILLKLKSQNMSEKKIDMIMDYIKNPNRLYSLYNTSKYGYSRNEYEGYGNFGGGNGGNFNNRNRNNEFFPMLTIDGDMGFGYDFDNLHPNSLSGVIGDTMRRVGQMRTLMSHIQMFVSAVEDLSVVEESIFDLGVVGQKSIPEIRQMRDSFLNMATTSRYSAVQLANAASDIVRVGYDYESSMEILKSGETLATASFDPNVRDATGTLIKAMTAFQLSSSSAAHAANSFHNIVNATPLDLKTFDDSLRQTAAAFGAVVTFSSKSGDALEEYKKQVLDTTAVLTGLQSMLGRTGSQAGTTLKQFATKLIAPQPEALAKFNAELRQKGKDYSGAQLASDVKEDLDKGLSKLAELYDKGITSYDTLSKMVG